MANTEKLKISAVIPAYNAEKYIARSINSVLNQTCPVDEIIVVDDGSTDSTAEVIKSYGGKVRYIHQQNAGVSAARNTGIQAATCEWVAFLDADDEWLPEKIERQVENIKNNPHLVRTTGNYIECLG
ncbi:MAG: glycosyltransferase family 2 protein, partial [Anaerohalosphaeraceae bacterium]